MSTVCNNNFLLTSALGIVFLYHGLTKIPGGPKSFSSAFGFPTWVGVLVILAELFSGVSLLFGDSYLKYLGALATIPVLLSAFVLVHGKNGFGIMNNGWEYIFVLFMIAMYIIVYDYPQNEKMLS